MVARISGYHSGDLPLRTSVIVTVAMLGAASHATDAETIFLADTGRGDLMVID
jgi:hypothetical protein